MVTTPTVWKPEFRLNEFTGSEQFDGVLADIGGGRFVSVWTDFDDTVADTGGFNLVGQIFDAEGNALGDPFQVNHVQQTGFQGIGRDHEPAGRRLRGRPRELRGRGDQRLHPRGVLRYERQPDRRGDGRGRYQ